MDAPSGWLWVDIVGIGARIGPRAAPATRPCAKTIATAAPKPDAWNAAPGPAVSAMLPSLAGQAGRHPTLRGD
jgi:hypothetical protein